MAQKLKCVGRYRNDPRNVVYQVGEVFEASDEDAAYLLADAPGCFEVVVEKAVRKPARDKAVRSAPEDK